MSDFEVEAYLATYMYMNRIVGYPMDEHKEEFKEEIDIGYQIIKLHSMIFDNTFMVEISYDADDYFHQLFLNTAKKYSKANNVPYDDKQILEQHMQDLKDVSINCN